MNEGMASVRRQGKGDLGIRNIGEFVKELRTEIHERRAD